jgi:uncharacterized protein
VDYKKRFLISFGGLKLGNHQFDFEINDKFFEEFEYSDYKKGSLNVRIEMEKQQRMLILLFTISGSVQVVCDRCLDPFPLDINGKHQLFVKFGNESHEESEDVIVIPENETRINVGHYIYEYIILSIPVRQVHGDGSNQGAECDPEVIKRLEELKSSEKIDPRWEVLNKLKK